MIKSVRTVCDIPIVLFGYYNPIFSHGNERFSIEAKNAGVDGILVVDLPPEESFELRKFTDLENINFISLIAPTTNDDRIKTISIDATGFLYYISITGVTGTERPVIENIKTDVDRIRRITDLPLVVGFGISTPQQAGEISACADGIVIGSAFVKLVHENSSDKDLISVASSFARNMKNALR